MRRVGTVILATALLAGITHAESLQERLRKRMKARPAPAAAAVAPGAAGQVHRQEDCQAKVDRARIRRPKGSRGVPNYAALSPTGRTVDCDGAAAVDRILTRKLPGLFEGHEPARFVEVDGGTARRRFLRLGARVQGGMYIYSAVDVGLYENRGKVGAIGVFDTGYNTWTGPQMAFSLYPFPWPKEEEGADDWTAAPWVKVRLDHGALYYGQFEGARPHGLGFLFADDLRAGRVGFFFRGERHGDAIEWETRYPRVLKQGGSPGEPLRASIDWVHRTKSKLGTDVENVVFQTVPQGYLPVAGEESYTEWNPRVGEREAEASRQARIEKERAVYRQRFDQAQLGDVLDGGQVVVRIDARSSPRCLEVHTGDRIEPGDRLVLAALPTKVEGFGAYDGTPAARTRLTKWAWKKFQEHEASEKAQEKERQATQASAANRYGTYQAPVGGGSSSYRPPVSTSMNSYQIGSSQWHQFRALVTHPMTYYQNKY